MKVFPFFATVLMRGSCCNHTGNKSIVTTVDDEPDSIIVLYDRQSDLILWDEARTYRTFYILALLSAPAPVPRYLL